jgi:hypothetical protein
MKNLIKLTFCILLFSFSGSAQNFILKDGNDWSYKNYPRIDTGVIVGLSGNLTWYYEVKESIPTHDSRIYKAVKSTTFTTDEHPNYPHILKAVTGFSLVQLTDDQIVVNIHIADEDWLATYCQESEQDNLRTEGLLLLEKSILGTATQADEDRKTYLKAVQSWFVTVRSEANTMADDFLNGTLPDFVFTSKPVAP